MTDESKAMLIYGLIIGFIFAWGLRGMFAEFDEQFLHSRVSNAEGENVVLRAFLRRAVKQDAENDS